MSMNTDQIHGHKGRILVVDDRPEYLQLLFNILSEQGYTVHLAPSGELALQFLELMLPDLILLDLRMPGMDG
jgi:CheY-like chemotaxis protein